ncbi:MAG: hypothetical protein DMG13_01115 [Acidobacteria bacterium]|nr:MAG: hypothetical protein DMG13_01115 [Acidobacteriota bacterium]
MLKLGFCFLTLSAMAFGQVPPAEKMNKDAISLQNAVNELINNAIPGVGLQNAKAAYLEGYGLVVSLEAPLVPPRKPFGDTSTAGDFRASANQRHKDVIDKLTNLLKQKVPALESIGPTDSVAIIFNLVNTNPADVPDLPAQIVLTVKKQDTASGSIAVREYK